MNIKNKKIAELPRLLQIIFSVKNEQNHKVIRILGFKIKFKVKQKAVCIVPRGGLGDDLLAAPYFKYLKYQFKNCKIILLIPAGAKQLKSLAEYCSYHFDEILEYDMTSSDPNRLNNATLKILNKKYKTKKLLYLNAFYVGDNSTDNSVRSNFIKKIKCKEKTVSYINLKNEDIKLAELKKYHKTVCFDTPVFELERIRILFEKFMNTNLPKENMTLNVPPLNFKKKLILVNITAEAKKRCLPQKQAIMILNYLTENTNDSVQILLLGREKSRKTINNIIKKLNLPPSKVINAAGFTTLSFLPVLLQNCEFLISAETGTVHMAECIGCKTICISSGMYYGRFQPYDDIKYVYPDSFKQYIETASEDELADLYNYSTLFSINDIKTEDITDAIDDYLKITGCAGKGFDLSETCLKPV